MRTRLGSTIPIKVSMIFFRISEMSFLTLQRILREILMNLFQNSSQKPYRIRSMTKQDICSINPNELQDASAHAAASVANNEGKTICHAAACGSGSQHGSQRSLLVSWHSEVATPPHGAQSPDPAPAPPPSVAGTPSPNAVAPLPPRRKNANPSEPGAPPATGVLKLPVAKEGQVALRP